MAAYEEDVRQAIRIILGTNHGERVMRPDFGAGLRALLFEPMSVTTLSLAQHYVERALIEWEPRIDLLDVRVGFDKGDPSRGRLLIEIGVGQAEAVRRIVTETERLVLLRIRDDLQGTPRAVVATRRKDGTSAWE